MFLRIVQNDPAILLASAIPSKKLAADYREPVLKKNAPAIGIENISAKSTIIIYLDANGGKKILFQRNPDARLPIASLTKFMTAKVALDNYLPYDKVRISKEAVAQEEKLGDLKVGEDLTVKELIYIMLIDSSNDAAWALAEKMGVSEFVQKMNDEAAALGLENTFFVNPSGLDSDAPQGKTGYSSARNLSQLAINILNTRPEILSITTLPQVELYLPSGALHHTLINTNELIGRINRLEGGKTGLTPQAKGCLIIVQKSPDGKGHLIYVLLGSDDRFGEMEKLITWVNTAWQW